jgi:hypothetical protein
MSQVPLRYSLLIFLILRIQSNLDVLANLINNHILQRSQGCFAFAKCTCDFWFVYFRCLMSVSAALPLVLFPRRSSFRPSFTSFPFRLSPFLVPPHGRCQRATLCAELEEGRSGPRSPLLVLRGSFAFTHLPCCSCLSSPSNMTTPRTSASNSDVEKTKHASTTLVQTPFGRCSLFTPSYLFC